MSLDVVVYRDDRPWAIPKLDAFIAGLRKHGIKPEERLTDDWRVSDLAVVWAHRDTALHELQLDAGNHYLVCERGYIGDLDNRRRWTSLGYDGLNGHADFCNAHVGKNRWRRYFSDFMRPWKTGGDYALLMGQVRGDASLTGVDIRGWYAYATDRLRAAGWTVMFRPHPRDPVVEPHGAYALQGDLHSALSMAALVVTWNSTSAVDAVLGGVGAIAMDLGSMAWDVAGHSIGPERLCKPDRGGWAARLAYCQWTDAEISGGTAWDHLRHKLDD